jgi:hypothetical protein
MNTDMMKVLRRVSTDAAVRYGFTCSQLGTLETRQSQCNTPETACSIRQRLPGDDYR